ncbi:hypothetical protein [Streptomyces sp. NPDC051452]|uniref:hypothetical protein n=1 Tax=Streptomyces sp. NPDC051452 TaxID=3365654 RepID=UPI0037BB0F23
MKDILHLETARRVLPSEQPLSVLVDDNLTAFGASALLRRARAGSGHTLLPLTAADHAHRDRP